MFKTMLAELLHFDSSIWQTFLSAKVRYSDADVGTESKKWCNS